LVEQRVYPGFAGTAVKLPIRQRERRAVLSTPLGVPFIMGMAFAIILGTNDLVDLSQRCNLSLFIDTTMADTATSKQRTEIACVELFFSIPIGSCSRVY
jgi:hypothetical protein